MANRTTRAETLLSKVGSRLGLTEAGKNWIINTIDPFHDNPVPRAGIPDGSDGNNVCQLVKQSFTISAPPGTSATGTWDCNIVDWPSVLSYFVQGAYSANPAGKPPPSNVAYVGGGGGSATISITAGGITAFSAPTGAETGLSANIAQGISPGAGYARNGISLPPSYITGKHRVVSKGFEVYNTSPVLYKSGTVTCWRSPTPSTDAAYAGQIIIVSGTTPPTPAGNSLVSFLEFEGPPATSAKALLLPDSKQWDAEKGCYVVSSLHSVDVPVRNTSPLSSLITDNTSGSPLLVTSTLIAESGTGIPASIVYVPTAQDAGEFDLCGAYFTGLSPQSSLLVNYNVIVERFPGSDVPDLEVIATAAPHRDDIALALYSHLISSMPVGVPVGQNGLGDWFMDAVDAASKYIGPVLAAVPHPYAKGASMALGVAQGVVDTYRKSQNNARTEENPSQGNNPVPAAQVQTRRKKPTVIIETVSKPPPLPRSRPPQRMSADAYKRTEKYVKLQQQMDALRRGRAR